MASAASAMTRQAASGPALRSTNPITPGRPARNGDMAGGGRFPGSRGAAGTTFPGRTPWREVQAFRSQLRGQLRLRERPGNDVPYLLRPVFPLSPAQDKIPEQDTVG